MSDAPYRSRTDRSPSQRSNDSALSGASWANSAPADTDLLAPLPMDDLWQEQLAQAGWHLPRPSAPPPAPSTPRAVTPVGRSVTPRSAQSVGDRQEAATLLDQAFSVRARGELLLKRAQVLAELEKASSDKPGPAAAALRELQQILRVDTQA